MTFRRLYTSGGVHNYFWKAKPFGQHTTRSTDMASHGIRDQVAIVGMGCTTFGEHWDRSTDDLLVDVVVGGASSRPASPSTTSTRSGSARWARASRGLTLSRPLKIDYKPVTRVENFCATGSEAFRNACYAVASGAYDVAMAIGVEKLKDSGLLRPRRLDRRRTTAPPPPSPRRRRSACSPPPTPRSTASTPTR